VLFNSTEKMVAYHIIQIAESSVESEGSPKALLVKVVS